MEERSVIDRFFHFGSNKILTSDRLYIRAPRLSDWSAWASIRSSSREFLTPWEPTWPADSLTKTNFKARLRQYARDQREDRGAAFFIFRKADDQLVGSITLGNVRRGVAQTGTIGYWMGESYAANGFMFEALCRLIPAFFDEFSLRRIEAACVPENVPSASLLRKVGFTEEGYAREYLCINGKWRDHLLFALIKNEPIGQGKQD